MTFIVLELLSTVFPASVLAIHMYRPLSPSVVLTIVKVVVSLPGFIFKDVTIDILGSRPEAGIFTPFFNQSVNRPLDMIHFAVRVSSALIRLVVLMTTLGASIPKKVNHVL